MTTLPLSLRQRKILHILQSQSDFITSREIAKTLKVSSRTIRNDIHEMNELLKRDNVTIESMQSKGFLLKAGDPENLRKRTRTETAFLSREERIRYLAFRLCQTDKPLNLYDLEDEVYVSRSVLLSDLRALKQKLAYEPPFIRVIMKHDEIMFGQNENRIRLVLLSLFHEDWDYLSDGGLYYGFHFLDEDLLHVLSQETVRILFRQGIVLDDPTLSALNLTLAIMHHRYVSGHPYPGTYDLSEYSPLVLDTCSELFDLVGKTTGCLYPPSERKPICKFLSNVMLQSEDWDLSGKSRFSENEIIREVITRYLDKIRSVFRVDFSKDAEFVQTLSVFLHQLGAGSSLFSHFQTSAIKENLSAEYELAFLAQTIAPDYLDRYLNEDELCSLAACLSGAIRNYLAVHPEKKLRAVLFTHRNIANAWSLKRKILESFDLYLDITHIFPFSYRDLFDYADTDLVLTTVNKKTTASNNIDTVVLDDHPLAELGEDAMRIKLLSFKNIWPVPPVSVDRLLRDAFWHERESLSDPLQIMEMLGNDLIRQGIAEEQHLLDITRREARTSFAIKPGIVFLHTLLPARETRLSVMTLEHRIRWNDYRIGTIIMAVFKKEDLNLLFHLKVRFCNRTYDPDVLQSKRTKEELIPFLCDEPDRPERLPSHRGGPAASRGHS